MTAARSGVMKDEEADFITNILVHNVAYGELFVRPAPARPFMPAAGIRSIDARPSIYALGQRRRTPRRPNLGVLSSPYCLQDCLSSIRSLSLI